MIDRVGRIEGDVGGTRLQHCKERRDRLDGTPDVDTNQVSGFYSPGDQIVGNRIRSFVQILIADGVLRGEYCNGVGFRSSLLLDDAMDGSLVGDEDSPESEGCQLFDFRVGDERDAGDDGIGSCGNGRDGCCELLQSALCCLGGNQRRIVNDA